MEELKLSAITNKSPLVDFNPEKGTLLLRGTSCMENARSFYTSLISWVDDYAKNPASQTHLQISLNYFNTSSAKCLLELLEKAIAINTAGKAIQISWQYLEGDDDMKEAAETFSELINHPIEMLSAAEL